MNCQTTLYGKTPAIPLICILTLLISFPGLHANPITSYNYVTNHETTVFNELIWFQTGDTLFGPTHSNDYIGISGSPVFNGRVTSSRDGFLEVQPNPYFRYEPVLNAPEVDFPREYADLRRDAQSWIDDRNGTVMTLIRLNGANGIHVSQYPRGTPRQDSLIMHFSPGVNQIIYVDGDVEIEGILTGRLTVYSHGDMWLIGDIRYNGADYYSGGFDEARMNHQLGLVSDGDIIIENNTRNGRDNGFGAAPDDRRRHSIIINGSLIAHNGSFTFEQQNDEWDAYQGPTPDERGYVLLKGGVAQGIKGYLHRSNHDGTGYRLSSQYDSRLSRGGPPGFGNIEGRQGRILLFGDDNESYTISNASIDTLVINAGVEVVLDGPNALEVHNRLEILGTEEAPVSFTTKSRNSRSTVRVTSGDQASVLMRHVEFDENVDLQFNCDSLITRQCEFGGEVDWDGRIFTDSSHFISQVRLASRNDLVVSRCRFDDGIVIDGSVVNGNVVNNTITGGSNPGVFIRSFTSLSLKNNIIVFNRTGIVNQNDENPALTFNNVYGNRSGDYFDCEPGEGSVSADPMFYDPRREDYHLLWGSPCIDSGDPDMPQDADGTRRDMGAYAFDHGHPQDVGEVNPVVLPNGYDIVTVSPNPFNSSAIVVYNVPVSSEVSISLVDISGRTVRKLADRIQTAGQHSVSLQGSNLSAGVYLVVLEAESSLSMKKVVFIR